MRRILNDFGTQRKIAKYQKRFLEFDIPECVEDYELPLDVLDDCRLEKLKEVWKNTKIIEVTQEKEIDEYFQDIQHTFKLVARICENIISWNMQRTEFQNSSTGVEMTVSYMSLKDQGRQQLRLQGRDRVRDENDNQDEEAQDEHDDQIHEHVPEDADKDDQDDLEGSAESIDEDTLIQMTHGAYRTKKVIVALKGKGGFGDLTEKEVTILLFLIPAVNGFAKQDELWPLGEYIEGKRDD